MTVCPTTAKTTGRKKSGPYTTVSWADLKEIFTLQCMNRSRGGRKHKFHYRNRHQAASIDAHATPNWKILRGHMQFLQFGVAFETFNAMNAVVVQVPGKERDLASMRLKLHSADPSLGEQTPETADNFCKHGNPSSPSIFSIRLFCKYR